MDEPTMAQVDADVRQFLLVPKEHEVAFRRLRERNLARSLVLRLRCARHGLAVRRVGVINEAAAVEASVRIGATVAVRHADHCERTLGNRIPHRVRRGLRALDGCARASRREQGDDQDGGLSGCSVASHGSHDRRPGRPGTGRSCELVSEARPCQRSTSHPGLCATARRAPSRLNGPERRPCSSARAPAAGNPGACAG